jgi:hypothetical protein
MDTPNTYVEGFTLEPSPPERTPKPAPDPLLSLRENIELITSLCRFAEGLETESSVRKRWRLSEETWELLGSDDELVRKIDELKTQRVRSGALKRELAQGHVIRGVGVLSEIMDDTRASARHRVDSVKALNAIADPGPEAAMEKERIVIKIDMGADLRAAGKEPNPGDVITIEATPRPSTPKQIEDDHSERPDDEWKR